MKLDYKEFKARLINQFIDKGHDFLQEDENMLINYGEGSCQIDLNDLYEEVKKDNVDSIEEVYKSLINVMSSATGIFSRDIIWENVYPVIREKDFTPDYKDVFVTKPLFHNLNLFLVEVLEDQYIRYIRFDEVNCIDKVFEDAMNNLAHDSIELVELEKDIFILNNFDGFSAGRLLLSSVQKKIEEKFGKEHIVAFPDDGAFYISRATSKNIRKMIRLMQQDNQEKITANVYKKTPEDDYVVINQNLYDFKVIK